MNNWGAPWAYSSFLTEDAGGFLKKLFSGPTYAAEQIFKSFLCRNFYRNYARLHIPFAPDEVREFYEELAGSLLVNRSNTFAYSKPASAGSIIMISPTQLIAIEKYLNCNPHCLFAFSYQRVYIEEQFYTTKDYSANVKRNNSLISYGPNNDSAGEIQYILIIHSNCDWRVSKLNCQLKGHYSPAECICLFIIKKWFFHMPLEFMNQLRILF